METEKNVKGFTVQDYEDSFFRAAGVIEFLGRAMACFAGNKHGAGLDENSLYGLSLILDEVGEVVSAPFGNEGPVKFDFSNLRGPDPEDKAYRKGCILSFVEAFSQCASENDDAAYFGKTLFGLGVVVGAIADVDVAEKTDPEPAGLVAVNG